MAAEKELNRLRKLAENRICPNCGAKDNLFGFQAIVVPFKTFVCSNCKAAHQAFSHRCKSAGMSNWTLEEVAALDEANGGGNRKAVARWLSKVPDASRPSATSSQEALKHFIDQAYNKRVWESTEVSEASPVVSSTSKALPPVQLPCQQPRKAPEPDLLFADLLDGDTETSPGTGSSTTASSMETGSSAFSFITTSSQASSNPSSETAPVQEQVFDPLAMPGGGSFLDPHKLEPRQGVWECGNWMPLQTSGYGMTQYQQPPSNNPQHHVHCGVLSHTQVHSPSDFNQMPQHSYQYQPNHQTQLFSHVQNSQPHIMQQQPFNIQTNFQPGQPWTSQVLPAQTPIHVTQASNSVSAVADLFDPFAPVNSDLKGSLPSSSLLA